MAVQETSRGITGVLGGSASRCLTFEVKKSQVEIGRCFKRMFITHQKAEKGKYPSNPWQPDTSRNHERCVLWDQRRGRDNERHRQWREPIVTLLITGLHGAGASYDYDGTV